MTGKELKELRQIYLKNQENVKDVEKAKEKTHDAAALRYLLDTWSAIREAVLCGQKSIKFYTLEPE